MNAYQPVNGSGATQTGPGTPNTTSGNAGVNGTGGDGSIYTGSNGGGGGGGYYGGAGLENASGGGGSSWVNPGSTNISYTLPKTSTNGALVITPQAAVPTLTNLSPASGPVGRSVTLTGTGFTAGSTVSFNGTAATAVTYTSATSLTATVPTGATSGNVTVTTAGGTSNGVAFTVAAAPVIISFSPKTANPRAFIQVVATGYVVGQSSFAINGVGAYVPSYDLSRNTFTLQVPATATTGLITLTTPNGTASSSENLVITYPDLVVSDGTVTNPSLIEEGTYNSITITSTGVAALFGDVVVKSFVLVSGTLSTSCQSMTGPGSFTLAAAASLYICDPAGLSASGSTGAVQVSGTRSFSPDASYYYNYNGTGTQVTGLGLPSRVRNLTRTNQEIVFDLGNLRHTRKSARLIVETLQLTAPTSVAQLLTLADGRNFDLNGQALTLLSDADGTALVVNSSTGVVTGSTATMQRYIDASGNTGPSGYRHYAAPVSGSTVNDLKTATFTPVVNAAYNAAPNTLAPAITAQYPTLYGYDQSRVGSTALATNLSAFDQGYVSPPALSSPLSVGRGYTVQIGNTQKVDFTGTLTTGLVNVSSLSRGSNAQSGWQLVGNPYPAPLDWGTVGGTGTGSSLTNVDPAAYVFQSTGPYVGRYSSFTNGVGAGTGLIASGQGFFVRVSQGQASGSVTLTNANRVTTYGATPALQRQAADARPLLRLSLGLGSQPATVATAQDEAFLYFEDGATAGVDGQYDAYKLANPSGYYLSTVAADAEATALSIDGRTPLAAGSAEQLVPLYLAAPAGQYTLTATSLLNFEQLAGGTSVYLRDALTGTLTNLSRQPSYHFEVAAGSAGAGRFSVVLHPATALATQPLLGTAQASLYPNPSRADVLLSLTGLPTGVATVRAEVVDLLGRAVGSYQLPVAGGSARQPVATTGWAAGLYLVRLTALDGQRQPVGTLPVQRLTLTR